MERINENNQLTVRGQILKKFEFAYEVAGEKFFKTILGAPRTSGYVDELPIVVSERLVDVTEDFTDLIVSVCGQYRSFNEPVEEGRRKLILTIFVKEFKVVEEYDYSKYGNYICLNGVICNQPTYRETPLGRDISDLTIAVNRGFGKSDYIPCVVWGRNAKYVSSLTVGTKIKINGRIQSRKYSKKLSEYDYEERTAYEVSVKTVEVL